MSVTVLVPSALRSEVGGESRLRVDAGATLAEVLRELERRWPRFARRICDEQGQIRRFVNVYVDGEDARMLDGVATPVHEGAEIQVLPSIAGGAA